MMKTFAVGDIHGRFDCLRTVVARIEKLADVARIIYLGDYVDRGPQSREVVEFLMAGPRRPQDEWICLKGNHEDLFLNGPYDVWMNNGGRQTEVSFGTEPGRHILPRPEVLAWMRSLPLFWESEFHYFVHAGIMPDRPLAEQQESHLLWIRKPFLEFEPEHPKHIIHGHTITIHDQHGPEPWQPVLKSNRTNLDTGAFFSNRLSFAEFDLNKPGGPIRVETLRVKDATG